MRVGSSRQSVVVLAILAVAAASCVDVSLDLKTKPTDAIKDVGETTAKDGAADLREELVADVSKADIPDVIKTDVPDVPTTDVLDAFKPDICILDCNGVCCAEGEICCDGQCCTSDCTSRECGWDCCKSCGDCPTGYNCVEDAEQGTAVCEPKCGELCADKVCGPAGEEDECDCDELKGGCDDGDVCTTDVCSAIGQCSYDFNESSCDDGNECTENDACSEGTCAGTFKEMEDLLALGCLCKQDEDCESLENETICDGTLFCQLEEEAKEGICAVAPETIPDCDDGVECTDDSCDPVGGCVNALNHDFCAKGEVCTTDVCDEELGCLVQYNELPCDDKDPCTTNDKCNGEGLCAGGGPTECADAQNCTVDTCESESGCVFTPDDNLCDDQNACTDDFCDKDLDCQFVAVEDGADCDDGDLCTIPDSCVGGACIAGQLKECSDDNPCTDDGCLSDQGCVFTSNNENDCLDGDACNGAETCVDAVCAPGVAPVCEDEFDCTTDSCDPALGCQYLPDDALCDDGNQCTENLCLPATGCDFQSMENGAACDDGDECSLDDTCQQGECEPGEFDEQKCGGDKLDHDGLKANEGDICPYAFDPGNPDDNDIPGPDACEELALHGDFKYERAVTLSQESGSSAWRRTHEPVEVPLVNGIVDDSVVGYWKLDGGQAIDYSGNGHHGTIVGAKVETGVFGQADSALDFDGEDDYVEIPAPVEMPTQQITMAAWVKIEALENSCGNLNVLTRRNAVEVGPQMGVSVTEGYEGLLFCQLRKQDASSKHHTVYTVEPVEVGEWQHVACTYDGTAAHLWVDGYRAETFPAESNVWNLGSGISGGSGPMHIGNCPYCSGACPDPLDGPFNGIIDEVLLLSRAMSADEIETYVRSSEPYGTKFVPGAQEDLDDIRITEKTGDGDGDVNGDDDGKETVKRTRVIGPRVHSDTLCPAEFGETPVEEIPGIEHREDLCGVLAYWRLDGNADDVLEGYPGEITAGAPARGRFGDVDGARWFDGQSTYVDIPDSASLIGANAATLEAWFLWTGPDQLEVLITKPYTSPQNSLALVRSPNGTLVGVAKTDGEPAEPESGVLQPGVWHHGAVVYTGANAILYVDGIAVDSVPAEGDLVSNAKSWTIGRYSESTELYFSGKLDEILLHNVAKSPDYIFHRANPGVPKLRFLANTVVENQGSEQAPSYPLRAYNLHWGDVTATAAMPFVSSLEDAPPTVPDTCYGLLNGCLGYAGWWKFDEGRGTVAMDWSGNKNNGSFVGNPEWQIVPEGVVLSLDGVEDVVAVPDDPSLSLNEFTLEARAYPLALPAPNPYIPWLLGKGALGTKGEIHMNYFMGYKGALALAAYELANDFDVEVVGKDPHQIEDWGLVRATFDGGTLALHEEDTVEVDVGDKVPPATNKWPLAIGGGYKLQDTFFHYFHGFIDSIRIMSRALENDEFLHFPLLDWQLEASSWQFVDTDDDGILDDGDFSGVDGDHPCAGGQVLNCDDNAPDMENPDQADPDGDGLGSVVDNCPEAFNPGQEDDDENGQGDACEIPIADWDHDGLVEDDACPLAFDPDNPDDNEIPGPDACESLADHGEFAYERALTLSQEGVKSTWRRTHEPVEVPLRNGIIDDSLVVYWKLDGNGVGSSLGGVAAEPQGSVSFAASPSETFGQALDLSGTTAYVSGDLPGNLPTPGAVTVMVWAKPAEDTSTACMAAQYANNQSDDDQWALRVVFGEYWFVVGTKEYSVTSGISAIGGQWVHLAGVFDGEYLRIYANGRLKSTADIGPLPLDSTALPVSLGHSSLGSDGPAFDGLLDEFMLFHRALSPEEIQDYYRSGVPYGTQYVPSAQADFDDVRVTETPLMGDKILPEAVKRARVIGPRPHSDTPCPAEFEGWPPIDIPAITDREDLCGVLGYWRLDGDAEDVMAEHPGEVAGGAPAWGRFGDQGGARWFDGESSHIDVPGSESLNGDNAVTLEAWFRWDGPTSSKTWQAIATKPKGSAYSTVSLYLDDDYDLATVIFPTNDSKKVLTHSGVVQGRWHHAATTYDGEHVILYLDGLSVESTGASGGVVLGEKQWAIGWHDANHGLYFRGAIDEVILHSVAKSPDYIYHRANPGIPKLRFLANTVIENQGTEDAASYPLRAYKMFWGNESVAAALPFVKKSKKGKQCYGLLNECLGYVGWWRLNESRGTVAVDWSGNKLNGGYKESWSWVPTAEGLGLENVTGTGQVEVPDNELMHVDQGTLESVFAPAIDIDENLGKPLPIWSKTALGFADDFHLSLSAIEIGKLRFGIDTTGQESLYVLGDSAQWSQGEDYAAAALFGEGGMRLFVDHVEQQDSGEYGGGVGGGDGPFVLGANLEVGDYFRGIIDSFRFMSRELTADEQLHYPLLAWQPEAGNWGLACGGTICPVLKPYDAYCNARDFCEYAGQGEEEWDKWDVWVFVPPGKFMMGGPEAEGGTDDERPVHEVTIAEGFLISKYEIVVEQYEACYDDADPDKKCSKAMATDWTGSGWGTNTSVKGRFDHPQNGLTFEQASIFCAWLAPDGGRLPTEAEWEYAASGPVHRKYPWGISPEPTCDSELVVYSPTGEVNDYGCGDKGTWPADSMVAGQSQCGAHHMAGNVAEWVEDSWHGTYEDAPADGSAWVDPQVTERVLRGEAFSNTADKLRTARRNSSDPAYKSAAVGGRCVRPLGP